MNVEKCLGIIQGMTSRLMLRMRLGIWLLGWRIDKVILDPLKRSRLMSIIRLRYESLKRRYK